MSRHVLTMVALSANLSLVLACGGGGDDDGGGAIDAAVNNNADAGNAADAGPAPDAAPNSGDAVSGLTSAYTGPCDQVDLAWTNPTAAAATGVLVIRNVGGPVTDVPENGTAYTADEALPEGGVVAFVGDAETFQDTAGFFHGDAVHYAVFTSTDADAYSAGAATDIAVDQSLGAQAGKLSVSLTDNVVTVTNPGNFTVAGTAVFDAGTNSLTLDVGLTNGACRAVHNAKLVATTINEAAAVAAGDTTFAAQEALYYGPAALADAATASSQFTFTNVSGAVDPFEVDFSVLDSATLVLSGGYDDAGLVLDSSGAVDTSNIDMTPLEFGGGDSTAAAGAISPDGELLYLGHGQQPMIVTVDLTTLTAVGNTDLTGQSNILNDTTGSIGHVSSVAMSPDYKFLYAVLVTNDHYNYFCAGGGGNNCDIAARITLGATSSDVQLIRIDRETMVEVDRLTLLTASTVRPRAGSISMSADGTRGAIAIRREGKVFVVDLANMTIVDGDAATGGEQPFDVSASSTEPHLVALSADGTEMVVSYRGDGRGGVAHDETLDRIDIATAAITPLAVTTSSATTDNQAGALTFGPDGRLYYARKNGTIGLSVFDLVAGTEVELLAGEALDSVTFSADGSTYFAWNDGTGDMTQFDISNDATIPMEADGSDPGTFNNSGFGHMGLISPL